jgi:MoaA/NifB/PqqE/SkfB family radical SAM enzyme
MCLHWATPVKKVMSIETLAKIWQEMNDNNGESICLTGGDPVIHPKFNETLELPRKFDLGFVNTGNYRKDFKWELLKGIKWVRFSIDSLDNSIYKKIRARDNLHSEILPNIKRTQEYVKEVGINFTIQNINAHEVFDIIKYCVDEDIYRLILYPMHGDAVLGLTKEQEIEVIADLLEAKELGYWDRVPENNFQFLLENLQKSQAEEAEDVRQAAFNLDKHPCMINKIHLSIGSDGTVFPCEVIADDTSAYVQRDFHAKYLEDNGVYNVIHDPSTIHTMGNVNDESLIDIWKRNFHNSFRSEQCTRCWSRYQPVIHAYHENVGKKTFI